MGEGGRNDTEKGEFDEGACGGCNQVDANKEDCFGSTFPTCGGCLWAQGVIQCP